MDIKIFIILQNDIKIHCDKIGNIIDKIFIRQSHFKNLIKFNMNKCLGNFKLKNLTKLDKYDKI